MLIYDGSHYRPIVDVNVAKAAGLGAVIWKATEATTYVDPTYADAKTLCISNGLLFGAYHFGRLGSGIDQANYFLKYAQPDDKMLVALDWEASMGVAGAEQFAQRIHDVLGRWPVIYTRKSYAEPLIGSKPTLLTNCPLWVASYQQNANWPVQWYTWAIQQYSNGTDGPEPHGIPGIRPDIDMNWFNPRFGDITAWWGSDSVSPPPPSVADKFIAPLGPNGLQADGLWLKQPVNTPGQWYDANPFAEDYTFPSGRHAFHTGADLNEADDGDKGQPIRAVANGVILFADRIVDPNSAWGNLIVQESILPDGSKVWFRYAHSAPMQVKAGDIVTIGQHLSDVSNAFNQMPYHLHFDVSLSGVLSRGYNGAVDWPGTRLAYLEANYTDPYVWLKSHMEIVPVTNMVDVKWIAPNRVDILDKPSMLSTIVDTLLPGGASQIDKDTWTVGDDGRGYYKAGKGYVAADCVQFVTVATVKRFVNNAAGVNVRPTPAMDANGVPTGSPVVKVLAHATEIQVILGTLTVNGHMMDQVVSPVQGYVADWLLSVDRPK
jgi:lysozyme